MSKHNLKAPKEKRVRERVRVDCVYDEKTTTRLRKERGREQTKYLYYYTLEIPTLM